MDYYEAIKNDTVGLHVLTRKDSLDSKRKKQIAEEIGYNTIYSFKKQFLLIYVSISFNHMKLHFCRSKIFEYLQFHMNQTVEKKGLKLHTKTARVLGVYRWLRE